MHRLFIPVILLIVYGSLYPWHFEARELTQSAPSILLHSWDATPNRYFFSDLIINICLYVPFGMSAFALFRRRHATVFAWVAPVLLGAALSASIEMIQLFEPTRHCSAVDLLANTVGSVIGVLAGWVFEELSAIRSASAIASKEVRIHFIDRGALLLLFCFAAYLTFPFFPALSRTAARHKLDVFWQFSWIPTISATAIWFVAGRLLTASGIPRARRWLAFSVLAIPAQLLIVSRQPLAVQILGASAGVLLYLFWNKRTRFAAACFVLLLIVRGLAPFHFAPNPIPFSWLPFSGFLAMDWQPGMLILIEKLFYYGAAIWLLRSAGLRLVVAIPIVAATLGFIELAQTEIPGRNSEITDPLLALLMGALLKAFQPKAAQPEAARVEVLL